MSRRSLNRYHAKHPRMARLERRLHAGMDAVVGNSEAVVAELRTEGVPDEHLVLIRNGIDTDRFGAASREEARARLGLEGDSVVMVMLATLLPYKGHDIVLQALASVAGDMPADWCLLLAGRDEGIGPALRQQVLEAGLGDHVRFLGEVDVEAVPALLAAGDIGLLASREEGSPNAALEGMAAGLAMVVSDAGGGAEIIEDDVSGRIVPAEQPAALGQVLLDLSRDAETRGRLAAVGQARVRQRFSIERCVADYEALYERVLCGASPAGSEAPAA